MRRVPFNDEFGAEHRDANRDRSSVPDDGSKMLVIALSDLPLILTAFRSFSACEQMAYLLEICQKVETPQKLADRLNWSSRGSAYNIRRRLEKKKSQLLSGTKGPFWIINNQQIEESQNGNND